MYGIAGPPAGGMPVHENARESGKNLPVAWMLFPPGMLVCRIAPRPSRPGVWEAGVAGYRSLPVQVVTRQTPRAARGEYRSTTAGDQKGMQAYALGQARESSDCPALDDRLRRSP